MTELQKQNFEHTQRELAAADAAVRNLTTLRDDNQKSAEYATKKLAETQTILHEAKQKALVARQRFDAVINEIAPQPEIDFTVLKSVASAVHVGLGGEVRTFYRER